ncbi:MAG: ribonuclease HI [Candidatus Zambryskibacteria bacterium]|nr:ribonuclease HI [Candidatus Zambryskibacteria bacterium]
MDTIIFSDGAARGNPGPGGWGAIILTPDTAIELGGRETHTTNNRMELLAVISALESVRSHEEITIHTDSAYVINGITRWVKGWQKNKWKTSKKEEVLNKDLWQRLLKTTKHKIIHWKLIKGHSGTPGNERCDVIATGFADQNPPVLYNGSRSRYGISISISAIPNSKKAKPKTRAYSYVSMVNGEIKIHKTWDECKARVHGVSGARYKKSVSPANEEEIIREFSE